MWSAALPLRTTVAARAVESWVTATQRPAKNAYPHRKHDHVRPPGKISYALTVTGDSPYLGKHHT